MTYSFSTKCQTRPTDDQLAVVTAGFLASGLTASTSTTTLTDGQVQVYVSGSNAAPGNWEAELTRAKAAAIAGLVHLQANGATMAEVNGHPIAARHGDAFFFG